MLRRSNRIMTVLVNQSVSKFIKVCFGLRKLLFVNKMLRKTAQLIANNVLQPRRNIKSPLKLLRYQSNSANLIYDQYLQ